MRYFLVLLFFNKNLKNNNWNLKYDWRCCYGMSKKSSNKFFFCLQLFWNLVQPLPITHVKIHQSWGLGLKYVASDHGRHLQCSTARRCRRKLPPPQTDAWAMPRFSFSSVTSHSPPSLSSLSLSKNIYFPLTLDSSDWQRYLFSYIFSL